MAIKFQYNKTSLQDLNRQLKVRERALPTLKNKESALRVEVKKAKDQAKELEQKYNEIFQKYKNTFRLWSEFDPQLVSIEDVNVSIKKIAGVKTPVLENIDYKIKAFSVFSSPDWFFQGVEIIKELTRVALEREIFIRKMDLLDYSRKKTTQKVNLYEKVQIPGYEEAIKKIKRFLEDEENLSKSAQKIVKTRQQETGVLRL